MVNVVEFKESPDQEVIEALELLLEDAKAGKLVSYALIGYRLQGELISTFKMGDHVMSMIGELRVLERDILDCCVDKRCHEAGQEY